MDKKVTMRIDSLLKHIDLVLTDSKGADIGSLNDDSVLLRAVCFSVAQIGEQMITLEKKIGSLYPNLPWHGARVMRNFLIHEYQHVDASYVASTIENDLPQLKEAFINIRKDFE